MEKMSRVAAIKMFFGDVREVSNMELIQLRKDPEAFKILGDGALAMLGAELDERSVKA
jgi:hypothetical protein